VEAPCASATTQASAAVDRMDETALSNRTVLLVAAHFPPVLDSGCARPLYFAKYLPEFGFTPVVLTRRHESDAVLDESRLRQLPANIEIVRVGPQGGVDWFTHWDNRLAPLRIVERLLGKPDHWISRGLSWRIPRWFPGARDWFEWGDPVLRAGMKLVEEVRPSIIWATVPRFDSLRSAAIIAARTGVPLVADYRDPWTYGAMWNPATSRIEQYERDGERFSLQVARKVIFTSPLTQDKMTKRYPEFAEKFLTITNGFDGDVELGTNRRSTDDRMVISFVGTIWRGVALNAIFDVFSELLKKHPSVRSRLVVRFVGPFNGGRRSFDSELEARGLSGLFEFLGPVSHDLAKHHMREADVLLLFTAIEGDGNDVISSKIYEYLTFGKPILGVVARGGGDDWLLSQAGLGGALGTQDSHWIADEIWRLWNDWAEERLETVIDPNWLKQFHRRALTERLARVFDEVIDGPPIHESAIAST